MSLQYTSGNPYIMMVSFPDEPATKINRYIVTVLSSCMSAGILVLVLASVERYYCYMLVQVTPARFLPFSRLWQSGRPGVASSPTTAGLWRGVRFLAGELSAFRPRRAGLVHLPTRRGGEGLS